MCLHRATIDAPGRLGRALRRAALTVALLAAADAALDAVVHRWRTPPETIAAAPGRYAAGAVTSAAELPRHVLGVDAQTSPTDASWRLARHDAAGRSLMDLVLFRNGRGMHAAPAAGWLYRHLARNDGWKGVAARDWLSDRTGLIFDDSQRAVGFADVQAGATQLTAQGCAICHVGKVLGQVVPGLGNKNIDPFELAALGDGAGSRIAALGDLAGDDHGRWNQQSLEFCGRVADRRLGNLTQGLVPTSVIWSWFYRQADRAPPADMKRAAVKVPSLWGYAEKRRVGLFCDGVGDGREVGWAAAVELIGGQQADTVHRYVRDLEAVERYFSDLLPPAYPLPIDWNRAAQGKRIFADRCAACHGTYEKDVAGLPLFRAPEHVDIAVVDTDADRLQNVTPDFIRLVAESPLADILRTNPDYRPGYFAPRLESVWARFPYLHNGSVPNLEALLTAPERRPQAFSLRDAGEVRRFDPVRGGLTIPSPGTAEAAALLAAGRRGDRDVYYAGREGHSSRGHDFGTDLSPTERGELIEYLKTL